MNSTTKKAAFLVKLTVASAALLGALPESTQAAAPASQAQIQSVSIPSDAVISPAAPVEGAPSPADHYSHSSHASHSSHYSGR